MSMQRYGQSAARGFRHLAPGRPWLLDTRSWAHYKSPCGNETMTRRDAVARRRNPRPAANLHRIHANALQAQPQRPRHRLRAGRPDAVPGLELCAWSRARRCWSAGRTAPARRACCGRSPGSCRWRPGISSPTGARCRHAHRRAQPLCRPSERCQDRVERARESRLLGGFPGRRRRRALDAARSPPSGLARSADLPAGLLSAGTEAETCSVAPVRRAPAPLAARRAVRVARRGLGEAARRRDPRSS